MPRGRRAPHSPAVVFLFSPKVTFLELEGVLSRCRGRTKASKSVAVEAPDLASLATQRPCATSLGREAENGGV